MPSDTLIVPYKRKKVKKFKFKDSICLKLALKILDFCHLKWPLVYIVYAHLLKPGQRICKLCFSNGVFFPFSNKINNMIILIFHFSPSTFQLLISLCSICLVFQIMFQFCFKKYDYCCWRAHTLLVKQASQEHKIRAKQVWKRL
jgi:hypothetical protein